MVDVLDAATTYAELGWRVVPIIPGGKRPPFTKWTMSATTDLQWIKQWFEGDYSDHGVGIVTGEQSGIWVLDVDVNDGKEGGQSLAMLESFYGELPTTVVAATGSGGRHYFFRWSIDQPVTNGLATKLGPGLDIRGEGGQVVAAPTVHPNGTAYSWINDPTTPVADAPEWLYKILFKPNFEAPTSPAGGSMSMTFSSDSDKVSIGMHDDSIADWVNDRHSWHEALAIAGWTHTRGSKAGESLWTRPGKDPHQGHSAVLHEPDGPLVVFSTEVPADFARAGTPTTDGSGLSYSLFRFLAGCYYDGDMSACASNARTERNRIEAKAEHPSASAEPSPEQLDEFVDLAPWWDDEEPAVEGDVLMRTDDVGLMYGDQLNWIHGESGSGKTWVALYAAVQLIKAGRSVAWVHFEDPNPRLVVQRLKQLGVKREHALAYFHYFDPKAEGLNVARFVKLCRRKSVTFAVLDSIGEALNAEGVSENSDEEVGPWIANGPRAIVNAGIGFCGIDHTTKADPAGMHASGSKRKRAAITGASLVVEALTAPTRTAGGELKVTCAKDRQGNFRSGEVVAFFRMRHDGQGGSSINLHAPPDPSTLVLPVEVKRMSEVIKIVKDNPSITQTTLRAMLSFGSSNDQLKAISDAVEQGFIYIRHGNKGRQHHVTTDSGKAYV